MNFYFFILEETDTDKSGKSTGLGKKELVIGFFCQSITMIPQKKLKQHGSYGYFREFDTKEGVYA